MIKSRNQLMDAAYPDDVFVDDRTVDSHIKRLRRKFRAVDPHSARSRRSTARATASPMARLPARAEFLKDSVRWPTAFRSPRESSRSTSSRSRCSAGSIFYLDSYRKQLLSERYKLARIEAQITAEALAGATRERQDAVLTQIGKEQHMRLRMFDAQGHLSPTASRSTSPRSTSRDRRRTWRERFARGSTGRSTPSSAPSRSPTMSSRRAARRCLARAAPRARATPDADRAARRSRRHPGDQRRRAGRPDGTTLLTTRNAADITQAVRDARSTLGMVVGLALLISIMLSLFMARTIVTPLRTLARAAIRVRLGREREVEVPRLPERHDEIGLLARAVADMTGALRHRIDAVESFAADVAHEIKNPLASLRSAIDIAGEGRRSRAAQAADRRSPRTTCGGSTGW